MIMTIAKWVLIMVLLAVLIIIISVAAWAAKEIVRWVRKERGRHARGND